MKNIPKIIYLQIDADGETPEDFKELVGVTWCTKKMNPNDIEFILNGDTEKRDKKLICTPTQEISRNPMCVKCVDKHRIVGHGHGACYARVVNKGEIGTCGLKIVKYPY